MGPAGAPPVERVTTGPGLRKDQQPSREPKVLHEMHVLVGPAGILKRPEIVEVRRRDDGKDNKAERGIPRDEPRRDAKSAELPTALSR